MYTIHADFQRFRDVNLIDMIGATGVYVIWDARAKARPTYIGEGNILKRFTDHVRRDGRRFAHPWNGYSQSSPGARMAFISRNRGWLSASCWTLPRRQIGNRKSIFTPAIFQRS